MSRTPVPADDAAEHDLAVVAGNRLLLEPAADRRVAAGVEGRGNFGAFGAVTQAVRAGAATEREHHGIDHDRFARAGLAGERRQAAGEFEFDRVDDREVADLQVD